MVNTPMAEVIEDRAAKAGEIETPNQSINQSSIFFNVA